MLKCGELRVGSEVEVRKKFECGSAKLSRGRSCWGEEAEVVQGLGKEGVGVGRKGGRVRRRSSV